MTTNDYPSWICWDCGAKHGSPHGGTSTMHTGKCGWCGEIKPVTEPRDFKWPKWERSNNGH